MIESNFQKSSHSGAECFEARLLPDRSVECRDSGHPDGARLRFTEDQWAAFVAGVKDGEFDI